MRAHIKNGQHLYYELFGTQGPHLLMVHGLMSSRAQWIPNLKILTEFCRPVVVELFGHGRSPSPLDPEAYSPENYIREFEIVRNEVGIETWFICGQSLGAALTIRYSLIHPERITAQIFTNSLSALSNTRENENNENIEKLVRLMLQEGRGTLDRFPLNPSQSRFLDPEIKKALVKDIDLIDLEGFANNLIHLIPRCSVRNLLHEITVPTLLIAGKYDKQFNSLISIALKNIPDFKLIEFDGGHAVNIDAADRFNQAIHEFILHYSGNE